MWTLQEETALGDDVALLVDTGIKLRIRDAEIYAAAGRFTWTSYGRAGLVYAEAFVGRFPNVPRRLGTATTSGLEA